MHLRSTLFAALLPLSLIACGGGGDTQPTPEGMHYHFVVNKVLVPTNNTQSRDYGLDLNGDKTVDNQLGMVLGTLATNNIKVQDSIDLAVADGSIILLADFQTKDFMNTTAAGMQVFLGDNPSPPACNGSADTTCGKHLDGHGSFGIAASSPTDISLAGKIINGTFNGGPGDLTLQIALGGGAPISLALIGARIQASGISATGITSAVVAGALTQDDLTNKVLPAVHDQVLGPVLTKDCPGATAADVPGCKCTSGSGGAQVIALLDLMPADCAISISEIQNNNLFSSLLAPDVMIDGVPALSLGIKVTAVPGTFTVTGETL